MAGLSIALVAAIFVGSALAVSTSHWTQSSEADFKAGTFKQTVATSLGQVKLARAVTSIMGDNPHVSAVYALAEMPDGTIYTGTGPEGLLIKIKGKTVTTATRLGSGTNIFSLLVDRAGELLIGTGGAEGRVLRLVGNDTKEIFSADGVQYIWAMTQTPDGNLYIATGPNGQLFELPAAGAGFGEKKVLFKSDQNNVLCLLSDGKDMLWAGTDPSGLLYRINRRTGQSFVVYNAAESEVSALAMDAQGNLYAATADSTEPTRLEVTGNEGPAPDRSGHPEQEKADVPIPSQPPAAPKPPALPPAGPGEPNPIPPGNPSKTSTHSPGTQRADAAMSYLRAQFLLDAPEQEGPDQPPDQPPDQQPGQQPDQQPGNSSDATADQTGHLHGPTPAGAQAAAPNPAGANAIYKIDPDGFVTEIFRQNDMVLALVQEKGVLIAGTGSDGLVYQINPGAEETSVLTKVDAKVVTALLPARDGRILLGTSNTGDVVSMGAGYASRGTYSSPAMDAKQSSRWGKLRLHGSLPPGTGLTVATRSGNIESTTDPGWSDWSAEAPAAEYLPITSPSARFLQYRLTLTSKDGSDSPVIDEVRSGYQVPNLAPEIKSVKVTTASAPGTGNGGNAGNGTPAASPAASASSTAHPATIHTISWDASAANNDPLRYTIYFRIGSGSWTLLKDNLTDTSYDWDTRTVADGRYEVKVVASDAMANPVGQGRSAARVSEMFTVDNTPPEIGDLAIDAGPGNARIHARLVDRTSSVAALDYTVDSADDWQAVLPVDIVADSPAESYDFVVGGLAVGHHQITLRAADDQGNLSYQTLQVTIEKPGPQAHD
jgi:hypothetical protein